jgi:uncharacterized protein YbjT (DUF2867 family)
LESLKKGTPIEFLIDFQKYSIFYNIFMKTAIVLGASGLVGTELTKQLLENPAYEKVLILVRKEIHLQHPKLVQHCIDFDNFAKYANLIQGDDAFCCLGTTMKIAGSKEAFYKVDYEYVNNFARLAFQNGVKHFAMISAMGANANSLVYYNRVKGEIEKTVSAYRFHATYICRPAMLLGNRAEKRIGEEIGMTIGNIFGFLIPNKYKNIEAAQVAKAMIKLVLQGSLGLYHIESDQLQKF